MNRAHNRANGAEKVQSILNVTDLNFAQINLHHCIKATDNFCRGLKMEHTSVSLILEPWVHGKKVRGFGQLHDRLFYYKMGNRPRAAIHVSSDVEALPLHQFMDDDVSVVRVCRKISDGGDFVVASVYMPYDSDGSPPGPSFVRLVDYCKSQRVPLVTGADSNAHHVVWGSRNTNVRGESLLQYLVSTDLMIMNRGRKPTFVIKSRSESIDITLATSDIADLIHSWRVTDEETFSDHKLIKFSLRGTFPQRQPYRNPRKTNWGLYKETLRDKLNELEYSERYLTASDLDRVNDGVTKAMIEAYQEACPLLRPKPLYRSTIWSDELEEKKRKLRKAWNRAGRKGKNQEQDKQTYRELLKEYKKAQSELKEKCKVKFFEDAKSIPAFARVHKILAKDPTVQVGTLLRQDGTYTEDSRETAELLLKTHFPGSVIPRAAPPNPRAIPPSRSDWKFAERLTKKGKVKFAIHKFQSYKSPGLDEVFPALLKQGIDLLLRWLISIFKSSLALNYVPQLWEKVKVIFIPKPGRATHCEAKDFRPISLTSFLLKAVERLMDFYIRSEVLKRFPLHVNQHAYQMGKSTDTALHQMTQKIESMLRNGNVALGCFMDVEGAFDNTGFEVIERAARARRVEEVAIRWILTMLSGRTVKANVCGTDLSLCVTRGCPQGGILSPILWCMVIDSLLVELNQCGVFTQGYSDDVSSLVCGFSVDTVGDVMRMGLKIVEKWCDDRGLRVNPVKTKLVLFSKRRSGDENLLGEFYLFDKRLQLSAWVKYLGVIFDNKLTWILHLEDKLNKVISIFWMCRNAFGRTWGLSPRAIEWLYTAVVRPILCHGCIAWWPRVEVGTASKRLDKLQRLACLCITGAKRSTATRAMEALLSLPPLDLFIKSTAFNAARNMQCNGWWNTAEPVGHLGITNLVVNDILSMPSDQIRPVLMLEDNFNCITPEKDLWLGESIIYPPVNGTVGYTDGSRRNGRSGAGFFCADPLLEVSIPTGTIATVYQNELFAIGEICRTMSLRNTIGKTIYICTDSQSAIDAISSPKVDSKLVLECKSALNALAGTNEVNVIWVPGHEGIPGNERADELAGKGAETEFRGTEPFFGISKETRKEITKQWLISQHSKKWRECPEAQHTKLFCKSPSAKFSRELINLSRPKIKTVVEAITGHCNLNKYLHKIGYKDSPKCLCGFKEETGVHIIKECPRFRYLRKMKLGKPELDEADMDVKKMGVIELATFLEKTKRFTCTSDNFVIP